MLLVKQRVGFGDIIFDWLSVFIGVSPQGSVLDPVLIVFFINDLVAGLRKKTYKLYANDTKAISIIKENNTAFQHDFNRLVEWSNKWLIKFHAEKCYVF
jgi:hypothetical protein